MQSQTDIFTKSLEHRSENPFPKAAETKSALQSVVDHAIDKGLFWKDPNTGFLMKADIFHFKHSGTTGSGLGICTSVEAWDVNLHKYKGFNMDFRTTPVHVTMQDNSPQEVVIHSTSKTIRMHAEV